MQTVGGEAFHREQPTHTRILGKERKKSTTTGVPWPEMSWGGGLGLVNHRRRWGV